VSDGWCVVFDIDDTLYLETEYVASGFSEVDRYLQVKLGISGFAEQATRIFTSGVRGDVFDLALTNLGVDDVAPLVPLLVGVYREHAPAINLLPDAHAALDRCSAQGWVAIISDGPLASQQGKAGALGLARWASPVILTAAYGVGYSKPHQRAFQEVEHAHRGARFAYVADNPLKDFVSPAAMGWSTVRLRRDGGLHAAAPSGDDVRYEMATLDRLETVLV